MASEDIHGQKNMRTGLVEGITDKSAMFFVSIHTMSRDLDDLEDPLWEDMGKNCVG